MAKRLKEEEQESIPISYAGITEQRVMPSLEGCTLVESVRTNVPEIEYPTSLVFLALRQPGLYATFLGKIIAGSSFRSAAMACGFKVNSVMDWLRQGAADISDGLDTYCGRMLLDCQRAAALAVSDAEERVHVKDPVRWLSKGPAKDFHQGRMWQETPFGGRGDPQIEGEPQESPIDPIPLREAEKIEYEEQEDEGDERKAQESADKDLEEALRVLEEHQIVQSPEFIQQARNQFQLPGKKDDK